MRIIILLIAIASTAAAQYVTPVVNTNNGHFKPSALERRFTAVEGMSTNKTLRLFDPSDVNRYIDGSGNKYVVSNFWSMTLPVEIMNSTYYPAPTSSNYVFTGYAEYYDTIGSSFSATHWTFGWSQADGFYVRAFRYLSGMQWVPTTNQYVLSVINNPESGVVHIRPYSTTNLLATLAAQSEVVAATAGLVSTNETRNVRLNTLTVTNAITASDGTTAIIPRTRRLTDSASVVSADWENRYLYSSGGRLRLDWEGGILTSYHTVDGYSQSVDWINRALMDSGERTSMAWGDRNLQYPTSGVAADWSVDDVLTINGTLSLSGSLTLGGVTKSEWPAASSGVPAVWTNMLWGAVGTNSTYRMSWDVTNGTFKVEEILP